MLSQTCSGSSTEQYTYFLNSPMSSDHDVINENFFSPDHYVWYHLMENLILHDFYLKTTLTGI